MLYNLEQTINILGHCCNNLELLRDRRYSLKTNDFETVFHKIVFGALQNMALERDIKEIDGFTIDTYLSKFPVQYETFKNNNGVHKIDEFKKKCKSSSFNYAYETTRKMSLLRRFESVGMDISDIYDYKTIDLRKLEVQKENLDKSSIDDIKNYFRLKLIEIDEEYTTRSDSYKINVCDGLDDLIELCKQGENWGLSFQSRLFNAVFKGMKGSKYFIRSASSGGGKSRQSISDIVGISCPYRYDRSKRKWIKNENIVDSLFISSELNEKEIQTAFLSSIGAVPEEKFKDGKLDEEEWERIYIAKRYLEESKIHVEYTSNFSIGELENTIEKYIITHGLKYIFFDYIQVTANLSTELNRLFGYTLREDQMLNQLSTALKNIANKYDVFILSSTQLNRNHKFDAILDATHLRGGMAVLDKADYGVITMKVTNTELDKLEPIMAKGFNQSPTHGHHVIKNRGGKWVGVILWVHMDLDTMEVHDCFVTTQEYEFIDSIRPTEIEVAA